MRFASKQGTPFLADEMYACVYKEYWGFAHREVTLSFVYDRATFVSEWAKCAVIDRAYSGKWVANLSRGMKEKEKNDRSCVLQISMPISCSQSQAVSRPREGNIPPVCIC